MTRRDDMVFRPDLGRRIAEPTAPVRARADRIAARRAEAKGGPIRRAAGALAARKLLLRRRRIARLQGLRGARSARGGAGPKAARFIPNPLAILATVGVAAAAVATRLISGRSFEGIGQEVNNILLGDLDDEARAKRTVRERFRGDPNIARIVGQEGKVTGQIAALGEDLFKLELEQEKARSAFASHPRFQVNGYADMLILRIRDKIQQVWSGQGMSDSLNRLQAGYRGLLENKVR